MRYALVLVALVLSISPATLSSAAASPGLRIPAPATPVAFRGRRGPIFNGRSAKNWSLNRGTPADNSTIPTPINRNPKGRPMNSPVIFPKNM